MSNTVLFSVVSPSFLFVCLYFCLCVQYFCLNGFNFNPIIVKISYKERTGMLKCRLYMNIISKDSYRNDKCKLVVVNLDVSFVRVIP